MEAPYTLGASPVAYFSKGLRILTSVETRNALTVDACVRRANLFDATNVDVRNGSAVFDADHWVPVKFDVDVRKKNDTSSTRLLLRVPCEIGLRFVCSACCILE